MDSAGAESHKIRVEDPQLGFRDELTDIGIGPEVVLPEYLVQQRQPVLVEEITRTAVQQGVPRALWESQGIR